MREKQENPKNFALSLQALNNNTKISSLKLPETEENYKSYIEGLQESSQNDGVNLKYLAKKRAQGLVSCLLG
jgi:hypothetical protein